MNKQRGDTQPDAVTSRGAVELEEGALDALKGAGDGTTEQFYTIQIKGGRVAAPRSPATTLATPDQKPT